jgi:hypothetical protein
VLNESSVLNQAVSVIQKIRAQKNPLLDTALCRQAAAFFTRAGGKDGRGPEGTNQTSGAEPGPVSQGDLNLEAFSDQIVLALLTDYDHSSASEFGRKARIELGSALVQNQDFLNNDTRARLAQYFEVWLQQERSKPLRDEITRAIGAVNSKR